MLTQMINISVRCITMRDANMPYANRMSHVRFVFKNGVYSHRLIVVCIQQTYRDAPVRSSMSN